MALVHDDDLTTIGGGVCLSDLSIITYASRLLLTTQPDELMALMRSSLPTIQEFECGASLTVCLHVHLYSKAPCVTTRVG